jgi:hypothetical protein
LQVSVSVYFCLFPSTNKAPPEIIKKNTAIGWFMFALVKKVNLNRCCGN